MDQLAAIVAPFFSSLAALGEFAQVAAADMTADYQSLLAHDEHMTVTVEAYHDCRVDVRVLNERRNGEFYSRTSLLTSQATGAVVQFGIMRIDLSELAPIVASEITGGQVPLGRALIRHNVLRHVELQRLWRVKPGVVLRDRLQLADAAPIFARTARIVVAGRPTVEMLEIPKA